jgi:hypothetical protein
METLMNTMKTSKVRSDERSSRRLGVQTSRLICVSKDNLERLSTFRFHCERCNRWLPALAFYAKVSDLESETINETIYLARHEVKEKGIKGSQLIGVCEECARRVDQG